MGSSSSKQETELNACGPRPQQPVQYKTSIYGHGQLQHPVKPQTGPITKKKGKHHQSSKKGASQVARPIPISRNPSGPSTSRGAVSHLGKTSNPNAASTSAAAARRPYQIHSHPHPSMPRVSKNFTPFLTSSAEPTKPGRSITHPTPFKMADKLGQESKMKSSAAIAIPSAQNNNDFPLGWKSTTASSSLDMSSGTIVIPGLNGGVKSIAGATLLFYGQFRCEKCEKYWRSSCAQEGVAQNCSKCFTPTFPQR